jgi:hypothetical protein
MQPIIPVRRKEPFDDPAYLFRLVRPPRERPILVIVVRDTRSVLVHAHDGGIDHLHRRIMTGGQRIHDSVPDASPPPPHEAIVTSGAGTIGLGQVAPWST